MASASGQLVGRIALVTGAGSGIGRAVCHAFAAEGAKVAAVDLNNEGVQETISTMGADHCAISADISQQESVQSVLKQVSTDLGVPTIAVNAAGITQDKLFLKMDVKSFEKVMDVNLKGTFMVSQACCRLMAEHKVGSGSVINISSIVAKMGNVGQANYASSKAGVVSLTKTIAKEMSRYGVRCNTILPGFIETPMIATIPDKVMQQMLMMIPLGRCGQPQEIADACVFLASDKSSYITGMALEVSGGAFM